MFAALRMKKMSGKYIISNHVASFLPFISLSTTFP